MAPEIKVFFEETGVIDQKPGGKIVAPVKDQVIVFDDFPDIGEVIRSV
jgi:hypothetical protein